MARRLVQLAPGVNPGDAITNEIQLIDRFFQSDPFRDLFARTAVYAEHIHDSLVGFASPAHAYAPRPGDFVLYHYGIAARMTERIRSWRDNPRALIYHNVTPAEYYRPYSLYVAGRLERARRDLRGLRDCFDLVFADSSFNAAELEAFAFADVRILPVLFPKPDVAGEYGAGYEDAGENAAPGGPGAATFQVLFVGRIAPNKGHADLIKIFYYLRRLEPRARLILAGDTAAHAESYRRELEFLVRSLDLHGSVEFTGFVSDAKLAQLYRRADVFVSASAHEGFCVPLLEAMCYDVPVVAYAAPHSAVAETLGSAGVAYYQLDHPAVAEMVLRLLKDEGLRRGVLDVQRQRIRTHDNLTIFERGLYGAIRERLSEVLV